MNVSGDFRIHGPHGLQGPHTLRPTAPQSPAQPSRGPDQVDISPAAEAAIRASEASDVRSDLVARVRGEIAAGTYETPAKLDAALDALLDELG